MGNRILDRSKDLQESFAKEVHAYLAKDAEGLKEELWWGLRKLWA